ncbi:MAG: hypothetical protein K9G40_02535 [Crocinitomicaceae bacterium]|nr:hypothetical protein [Crocinitomicaceae bacterium]MCF8434972.1 hypothetical protein [Crocinitomicaceae bacterium]
MLGRIIIILLVLSACSKQKNFEQIKVYGHAGMGMEILNSVYHENSKEAIEMAVSIEGCEGVEMDVQLSKDNELWLFHDSNLSEQTNGENCVNELTSSELSQFHYTTFYKEKLAKFNDLDLAKLKGKNIYLDLRHYNECSYHYVDKQAFISAILASPVYQDSAIHVHIILSTEYWINDFINSGFSVYQEVYDEEKSTNIFNSYPNLDGIVIKNAIISKEKVQEVRNLDKKVIIFEMRSPKGIRTALKKYPDAVITDDIRATLIEKY